MNRASYLSTRAVIWVVLLLALPAVALYSLFVGEVSLGMEQLLDSSSMGYEVMMKLRLPRVLLACAVGGALSLAGVLLQGVYHNPLVEPFTMGVSGGAAMGVTLGIVLGFPAAWGTFVLPISGGIGALCSIFLVYVLSMRLSSRGGIQSMILIGVMISFISSSAMLFFLSISSANDLQNIIFWTMGSLQENNYTLIYVLLVASILVLGIAYLFTVDLNAMRLGEAKAKHLGVNTKYVTQVIFLLASLMTGFAVAVAGIIGFVGLIIPHVARLLVGSNYRHLLGISYLMGSLFLMICDLLARTILIPNELPIGVITGIIGGLFFLALLSSKIKKGS